MVCTSTWRWLTIARLARLALLALLALLAPLALGACSSTVESKEPSIYGNWIYVNSDGTAGFGASFKNDGSYVATVLFLTSDSSANAEIETGTFTDNGSSITITPQQSTCPGPDPVNTYGRSFSNGNLVLSLPSGMISLKPNNATATDSFVIVYGCLDSKTKAFQRADLAPVDN